MQNDKIEAFKIDIAPDVLSDLQQRLKNTRWSFQIDGTGWDAGTDVGYLKDLLNHWQNGYDWRKHERTLNQFSHFKTDVDDIGIHFVHVRFGHIMQKADDHSPAEKKFFEHNEKWLSKEGSYALIQSSKPQSLAHGLNDSAAGLASWIVEKLRAWSDCNGEVESRFSKDE